MIEITMVVKATYEVYGGEYVDGPSPAHDAASLLLFAIEAAVNDGILTSSEIDMGVTHLTAETFTTYNSPYGANVPTGDVYEYNPDGDTITTWDGTVVGHH
jgi:hypothetical protein